MEERTIFEAKTNGKIWKITEKEGVLPVFNRLTVWLIDDKSLQTAVFPFCRKVEDEAGISYLLFPTEEGENLVITYLKEQARKSLPFESEVVLLLVEEKGSYARIAPLMDIRDGAVGMVDYPDSLSIEKLKEYVGREGAFIMGA